MWVGGLLLGSTACFNNNDDCDPNQVCDYYVKPDSGYYNVNLTIDDEFTAVYLVVFRGQYDEKDTVFEDVATQDKVTYYLEEGQYYATAAYYIRGGKTYVAIDGDNIKASNNQNCGEDCWSLTDGNVKVTFKE